MTGENGLHQLGVILWLIIVLIVHSTYSAPVYDEDTQVAEYEGVGTGCHYNFQDYEEGDRIMTNEPCLNCTCHNRMLMCYLRVCPQFTKAIGQNCKVEKRPDQCCPVITCPEVPVQLLTSTTSAPSDLTEVGFHDNYGCSINNKFYADGAQLPTDPNNPCELCYCIRNRTTCTMQQCTLNIAQCNPVYHVGICCPVKYDCDYNEETKTTLGTTPGLIMTTTITPDVVSPRCSYKGKMFNDGDLIYSTEACHHCYCFRGDIACAIQDCGKPMETHGKNCTASTPPEGECCPTTYECESTNESAEDENQQKVTHDENEIVATQASLPMKEEDLEQKYEEDFPGANNAISQDSQVHEEITIKSIETTTTTESTTEKENNQVPEKETPTSVFEDNAVPQEPIMPEIHVDEATQSTDEFNIPTKPIDSIEVVDQTQSTTISNEVEATRAPTKEKPTEVLEVHTETSILSSEKPSTNLPARSEDQFPLQQLTIQPEEILTTTPNIKNEFSETAVTVPVITETENNNKVEEKPITHIFDSNEIPKVPKSDEETNVEEIAAPGETTTIMTDSETEKKKLDEAETEASSSEMPEASTESKLEAGLSETEMPEAINEDKLTTQPSAASDITDRIPEQESTTTGKLEEMPKEETPTTHSIAEQPMSTQRVPTTEIVESKITDIPTVGPSGIVTETREPVNEDHDNESASEVQVTEGYDKQGVSEETQTAENLMTDKPEVAMETFTEAPVPKSEEKPEQPQVSDTEPTALNTGAATIEPETQMPGEHIQRIPPTPIEVSMTEGPIEHGEQSTQAIESEVIPTTYSTEAPEDEIPMKGLEVSGEQSSEEAMSPATSTEIDKQSESSEESLEEDNEKTDSPSTPSEHSTSTEFSTEVKNEITTEEQITELPMEKEIIIPNVEEKPSVGKPVEEPVEEKSTEKTSMGEEITKEKPVEETSTVMKLPESVEETQTTEIQTLKADQDQTTLRPQEPSTATIGEEILTSTFNESSSTSVPVEIEHTDGTTITEEVFEPSVTPSIPEFSTKDTNVDQIPSDKSQSTELPIPQENATEMEQSIQPVIDGTPEIKPEEALKPTDESISTSEQSTTEFDKSDDAINQQPELSTIMEKIKPTEMSVIEQKPAEGASLTPIDLPMNDTTEEKYTTGPITEIQTIETVTESTITEKETLGGDEVQQTQKPSVVSEETEITITVEKSTEPAIFEKEPSDQIATTTEQDLKPDENLSEAGIVAVTVPETNELPTDIPSESKPEESSSEKTHVTPLLEEQDKSTEMPISEEQPIAITTESSINGEKSTENTITSEIMPISVTEQQPNEEPVKITEIFTESPVDDTTHAQSNIPEENSSEKPISTPAENLEPEKRPIEASVANVTHAEVIPVKSIGEPTVTSIPTKEPTSESTSELSTESIATTIENKESGEFHETHELPSESITEPAIINEETTTNSEPPNKSLSTESNTELVITDEQTTVFDAEQTEKSKDEQEENQEGIAPSLTTSPTVTIEKGTKPPIPHETEISVEEIQITTDATVSESSTKLPTEEEKPHAVPELIPSNEQQFGMSTENSMQSVESTDKFAEEPSLSTETSDEILPTTFEDLKPLGIPGEGNCLMDGETYTNNSVIPPIKSCQISCRCVSSIVECESVQCPPPPKHDANCMPVLMRGDTCCPTYTCETVPTSSLEADNQMAEEHLTTEKPVHEAETEAPSTDKIPSDDATAANEVTKPSEEQVTVFYDQKESTSVTPAESSSTVESEINVTVEPLNIAPGMSNESTEHTKSPEITTTEVIPEIETSSTLPQDKIELTKPAELDNEHVVPSLDNRVSEHDKVDTVTEEGMDVKIKPTTDSHAPEGDNEEVVSVLKDDGHSISILNNTRTESATISPEKIDESSMSTEVHDGISTDTSEFVTPSSSEAQEISTISEESSVTKEKPTTIIVESPIENIDETSEKYQEGSSSSEHPSELTSTSTIAELSTENSVTEKTEANDNVSSYGEEQTGSTSSDIEMTTSPLAEKSDVKPPNGTLPVSNTDTPMVTEEHKDLSENPIEIPKTEKPEEQGITIVPSDDKITVPAIPLEHSITKESTTAGAISEETTEPFIISQDEAEKSTESPQSHETASSEPVDPSVTASSSIAPESSEQTKPSMTDIYKEQTVEPFSSELTETSINEFNAVTTPSMNEAGVTETSVIMNKPHEEHTSSASLPNVTESEESSEETAKTTSPSTESSILESESTEGETEQYLTTPLANIVPVESELSTEKYHTEEHEKATEGITNITQIPEIESQTETAIANNETSESPVTADEQLTGVPLEMQPSPTADILPEHVNASVIVTEKTEEATKLPEEETSSLPATPELSPVPKIPTEEHVLPTETSAETVTDFSNKEPPTEASAEATESPTTSSVISETAESKPVSQEKPIGTSVEDEKETTTKIKVETPPTIEEMSTAEITKETESLETTSPIEDTLSTVLPTIVESSTPAEEISPMTSADEKPTNILTNVSDESTTTPAILSSTKEAVTQSVVVELTTQPSAGSFDEHTMTPVESETSEKNPAMEIQPSKESEHTTDETKPADLPVGSIDDDTQHPISDPSLIFEHGENEGQQVIEPEIVQEHVTETEKNLTSLDHGYIPPSTTEAPIGGEYPEQSVSGEENPHFPINGGTHLNPEEDYDEDDQAVYGPGTCRYGGKVYVSAQQIPRDDPCDFCFCFRGDIICLQQSCPPPIPGCHEEPISGFCCPRYECPVSMATSLNITTTTTTTTTTLPPHFLSHAYKGATRRSGCQIRGQAYKVGEVIQSASGPCLHCICGGDGNMKCEPRICTPEPMIRQMIAAATAKRRR